MDLITAKDCLSRVRIQDTGLPVTIAESWKAEIQLNLH